MMRQLRKKIFKNIFGVTLLCIMLLKVCAFSISYFSSCGDPLAVEKSVEEGKDTKEEAFDKKEKKLLGFSISYIDHGHLLWTNHLPLCKYSYLMQIGIQPLKTVPTPPPDSIA
jgi:hypothetical protein